MRDVPSRGPALGVRANLAFAEDEVPAESGDLLALYTDGLTEARNADGEFYGVERLQASFEEAYGLAAADALEAVWSDVAAFRGTAAQSDDATLLLARFS